MKFATEFESVAHIFLAQIVEEIRVENLISDSPHFWIRLST
jgi:hypothetical protein